MSLAIKIEGNYSGFIYFDAVTQYTKNLKGQLTSHPIGSGGLISDHFIRDNPRYQFSGVVSAADISVGTDSIRDDSGKRPMNVRGDIPAVNIKGSNRTLISLIPQTISQFFVDAKSSVSTSVDSRSKILDQVKTILESLFREDGITTVKLFDYKNLRTKPSIVENLVVTDLSFEESADSGVALYVNITLSQATFTTLQSRKLTSSELSKLAPKNVAAPLKEAAAPVVDAGNNPQAPNKRQSAVDKFWSGSNEKVPPIEDALLKNVMKNIAEGQ